MPDITMYHGWVNYPTWLVYSAITDEDYFREVIYFKAETCASKEHLAAAIREGILDMSHDFDGIEFSFLWDLLQYALNEVSWLDIARHIWQEVHDE